jgi:hypothetical protein
MMKKICVFLLLFLFFCGISYGNFSALEVREYNKYLLSLWRLGLKDLAQKKLKYALKKYGKLPVFLNLKAQFAGKKKITPFLPSLQKSKVSPKIAEIRVNKSKSNIFRNLKVKTSNSKNKNKAVFWKKTKNFLHSIRYYSYFIASIGAFLVLPPL